MATSSIFHNFTITDKKEAERFVEVLDKAAHQPKWKPQSEVAPLVRDPERIRAIAFGALAAHKNKQDER